MRDLVSAWLTDTGVVRNHNEDHVFADAALGLWIVADGMGGHDSGEIASQIAVERIPQYVREGHDLSTAIQACHSDIRQSPQQGIGSKGMGTTVVAALLDTNGRYQVAWVGDSRAYVDSPKGLQQISRDHSFVQHLVDTGAISAAEAETHPERNVITQSLGTESLAQVRVDVVKGQLYKGERLLLCSDGLSGEVKDAQIHNLLQDFSDSSQALQRLIQAANDNGGHDNISGILIEAPQAATIRPVERKTRKMKSVDLPLSKPIGRHRKALLSGATILAFLVLACAVWWWKGRAPEVPGAESSQLEIGGEILRLLPVEVQASTADLDSVVGQPIREVEENQETMDNVSEIDLIAKDLRGDSND